MPAYATKATRRYSYYETRKDLARPADPPSTRFSQGLLDGHVLHHLGALLEDDHGLRRLANIDEAELLRTMFKSARLLWTRLKQLGDAQAAIRSLVALIKVEKASLELTLKPAALGLADQPCWHWNIPLPARKPFHEAKLKIDAVPARDAFDLQLVGLLADALDAQRLVLSSPHLSLNQLAISLGRCRKQLTKLFRLSWLSPRIVEAIMSGRQPRSLTRTRLLEIELPINWSEQESLFGVAA